MLLFCGHPRDQATVLKPVYCSLGALLLMLFMLIALVYGIPAAWVAQHLAGASGGRLQLVRVSGLWHRGSAIVVISSGQGGSDAAHWQQRVHWDLKQKQWPGIWALRITWPELGPPLYITLGVGLSSWQVNSAPWRGAIPLTVLAGLGAPFNTLALEGAARISMSELRYSSSPEAKPVTVSNVEIAIARLRSALAQGVVLGDYVVRGNMHAAGGTFELRTVQGMLLLDGIGQCGVKNRFSCSFQGTARAARQDDASLANVLGLLGKQQSQDSGNNPITELRW